MYESEQQMENKLITQLQTLGFAKVKIVDKKDLEKNLKTQLEKFNKTEFSESEFSRILNHLNKGNSFEKAKILRNRFVVKRDENSQKKEISIQFFNTEKWCQNQYQVSHQIKQKNIYENRYDVTLLINGLPLVQIELKRRGLEMKEAFNQINRYQKQSFEGTLFDYVQIFIISNGVNTKYFANNKKQSFVQTFFWTDKENNKITKLTDFANCFLEKCQVSQIIAEYIVLAQSTKTPMILRPYQYFAVKEIEKRVINTNKNGYIWHTTGSGKTLTSFKTAQILTKNPEIKKVIFVVDRKDLDLQTVKEFNSFSDGAVDGTDNTKSLVNQLKDKNNKLIVTTIQKLDRALNREHYLQQFSELSKQKVVIIFDECHRSQFGKTHKGIREFFQNAQLFGFTGTPIFAENHNKGITTKDVFDDCLHKYIITNAISDNNVLGFSVEYVGKYTKKENSLYDEIEVAGIDTKELFENPDRLEKIADYILKDWKLKTKNGQFNAIFATPSIEILKKYYTILKNKKSDDFKIATIFSYQANEEAKDTEDNLDEADFFMDSDSKINEHSRDFLEQCIANYNEDFGENFSTDNFDGYYKSVQKKVKNKEIDLVIVVNMMLTGFDSKTLNTLYVDKNLKHHGLIQAYSRTNRIFGKTKPHGNIVCFRNLKEKTDEALEIFGDENAKEIVFKETYEKQKIKFQELLKKLKETTPFPENVNSLNSETEKTEFITSFRDLLRQMSSLEMCNDFSFADLEISQQEFEDYKSKYLDLYEDRKNKDNSELVSAIDDIDFELELIRTDNINFDYIIQLLISLNSITIDKDKKEKTIQLLKTLDSDISWRKRKYLIEKFIEENLPKIENNDEIEKEFANFFDKEANLKMEKIAKEENIDLDKFKKIIAHYRYNYKIPQRQNIIDMKNKKPVLAERSNAFEKLKNIIIEFSEVFDW